MIYALLVIYQIKHFVCDYPLQGKYMLGKFKPYPGFILPLSAHCGVHGVATLLIALCVNPKKALVLALLDFCAHFTMDLIKANPSLLGRFKAISKTEYEDMSKTINSLSQAPEPRHPEIQLALDNFNKKFAQKMKSNTYFWWSLGLDQTVHHLTHYLIIWSLLK